MRIDVQIDTEKLVAKTFKEEKRLAYAAVEAINKAGVYVQGKIRDEMTQDFHLRTANKKGKKWLLERIKFKFASVKKGLLFAEIYVDQKPRLLLGKFEKGGTREAFVGKNVAVPNPSAAREGGTVEGEVKDEITFKRLGFVPRAVKPKTRPDTVQYLGNNRTFLLKSTKKAPMGGVFQRVGPGADDIRLVYSFKKAFQLKRMLHIVKTAQTLFLDKFRVEFVIAMARKGGTK